MVRAYLYYIICGNDVGNVTRVINVINRHLVYYSFEYDKKKILYPSVLYKNNKRERVGKYANTRPRGIADIDLTPVARRRSDIRGVAAEEV